MMQVQQLLVGKTKKKYYHKLPGKHIFQVAKQSNNINTLEKNVKMCATIDSLHFCNEIVLS